MVISESEKDEFFALVRPFQLFCNEELDLVPSLRTLKDLEEATFEECCQLVLGIREHPELIEAFCSANPMRWKKAKLDQVLQWQRGLRGDFIALRFLKKGAMLQECAKPYRIFQVLGLNTPIEELCGGELFCQIRTQLLPFKGAIVSDGIVEHYNIYFGSGYRADLKESYRIANNRNEIWTNLLEPPDGPRLSPQKDWSKEIKALTAAAKNLRGAKSARLKNSFALVQASVQLTELLAGDDLNDREFHKKIKAASRALNGLIDAYNNDY